MLIDDTIWVIGFNYMSNLFIECINTYYITPKGKWVQLNGILPRNNNKEINIVCQSFYRNGNASNRCRLNFNIVSTIGSRSPRLKR